MEVCCAQIKQIAGAAGQRSAVRAVTTWKEHKMSNFYFLRVQTKGGPRYAAKRGSGRITTLHPSIAERLDFDKPLPAHVSQLVDDHGGGEFVRAGQAECLHPTCDCTWGDERPNVK